MIQYLFLKSQDQSLHLPLFLVNMYICKCYTVFAAVYASVVSLSGWVADYGYPSYLVIYVNEKDGLKKD